MLLSLKIIFSAQLLVNQTMYFSYNWFDNISTPQVETRDEMIQTVFQEVVQQLSAGYGNDVNDWQYGTVYPMLFGHPIGTSVSLFSFLNNGPIAAPGGESVRLVTEKSMDKVCG